MGKNQSRSLDSQRKIPIWLLKDDREASYIAFWTALPYGNFTERNAAV